MKADARTLVGAGLLVGTVATLSACAGNSVETFSSEMCRPPAESRLAADYDAAGMKGAFTLWMFADQGEFDGAATTGDLVLEAYGSPPETALGEPPPLHGTTTIDPAQLGAAHTGDVASTDPRRPGVLVLQTRDGAADRADVTIRLGAVSNRMDHIVFDGSYTVLRPTAVTDTMVSGRWESGAGAGPVAGGRFCAVRT
jgi:hypothetical protein